MKVYFVLIWLLSFPFYTKSRLFSMVGILLTKKRIYRARTYDRPKARMSRMISQRLWRRNDLNLFMLHPL